MRDWKNEPASEKQMKMIETIQENSDIAPKFTGSTKGEAFEYIKKNIASCYHSTYNPHEDAGDRI